MRSGILGVRVVVNPGVRTRLQGRAPSKLGGCAIGPGSHVGSATIARLGPFLANGIRGSGIRPPEAMHDHPHPKRVSDLTEDWQ